MSVLAVIRTALYEPLHALADLMPLLTVVPYCCGVDLPCILYRINQWWIQEAGEAAAPTPHRHILNYLGQICRLVMAKPTLAARLHALWLC